VPEKLLRLSSRILERLNNKGITVRKVNLSDFTNEIDKLFHIYNSAWEKNWGFVPMTEAEFKHAAKDMKQIIDPDFVLIAEHDGKPIGFSLTVPDLNVPLKKLKKGRLLPFGIFKFLYYKRKIDRVRVVTLGILEDYRKLGIDAYFYMKAFEEAKNKKMLYGEASWILENNEMMNRAIKNINGAVYKKHRLYKKAI
jgi:GNAT superfamily N-acetyltransferase